MAEWGSIDCAEMIYFDIKQSIWSFRLLSHYQLSWGVEVTDNSLLNQHELSPSPTYTQTQFIFFLGGLMGVCPVHESDMST